MEGRLDLAGVDDNPIMDIMYYTPGQVNAYGA